MELSDKITNPEVLIQIKTIHELRRVDRMSNVFPQRTLTVALARSLKGKHLWCEMLLDAYHHDIKSSIFDVIGDISAHEFHSEARSGCKYCAVVGSDQGKNRDFMIEHFRERIYRMI